MSLVLGVYDERPQLHEYVADGGGSIIAYTQAERTFSGEDLHSAVEVYKRYGNKGLTIRFVRQYESTKVEYEMMIRIGPDHAQDLIRALTWMVKDDEPVRT